MVHNLSTSKEMKQRLEADFKTTMSTIGTTQPGSPAWFINGEFVLTKLDKRALPIKLGDGGSGTVFLSHFLDVGVAKKVFHQDEDF